MSDDLERTISESLDRHARRLGPRPDGRPDGHLDAVWTRLDRRRNRRRGVAAVGSVLAVGAGVTGIVMVGGAADAPAPGDGAPITTLAGVAWRCTGLFGDDGIYRYYTDCSPVAELPPLTSDAPLPNVGPSTVPPTFAPTTAIVPAVSTAPPFTGPATTAPGTVYATTAPAGLPSAPPTTSTSSLTTAPSPTEPPAFTVPPPGVDSIEYEVQMGDSLAGIASAFGVGPMEIVVANGWEGAEHVLLPGEIIVVPIAPTITAPPTAPVSSMATPTTFPGPCEDASGTVPCPTLPPFGPATTAPAVPSVPTSNSFRCSGFLGHDGTFEYFAACELIGPDGAVQPGPSSLPGTLPATVAPTTGFGSVVTNPPGAPSTVPVITNPPTVDTVLPSMPVIPTTAGVVPILAVYEDVAFYPACGNETLDHEGTTWYPIVHVGGDPMDGTLQRLLDDVNSREREPSPVVGVRGFARVSAPGPGDDVGTLVVWADGVARWVSSSGSLDVVMTDDPVTYNWEC